LVRGFRLQDRLVRVLDLERLRAGPDSAMFRAV
jgi:hypothetical protein